MKIEIEKLPPLRNISFVSYIGLTTSQRTVLFFVMDADRLSSNLTRLYQIRVAPIAEGDIISTLTNLSLKFIMQSWRYIQ